MSNPSMVAIERDAVLVSGADAGEYLQTQLTQDVLSLGVGETAWSFLLTPKSEIIALMQVTRSGSEEYALETEKGYGETVRRTIDEFLGRMDVSFEESTPASDVEDEQSRIARGWPRMGKEIDGTVTPAMVNLVPETIAFDKGCYTGQEFVARVHYRGAEPPKRLVRIVFDENSAVSEDDPIIVGEDEVGVVTSAATGVALGFLKRGVDTPSAGRVGDVEVELLATRPS